MLHNLFLTTLISFLYIIFFEKLSDVVFKGQPLCRKNSNRFVLLFVAGVIGMALGRRYLEAKRHHPTLKNGITFGGALLAMKITISYWHQMNDQLKLAVIAFSFGSILMYAHLRDTGETEEEDNSIIV